MTYLLDANVFIEAKNLHYGLDFCPAFWEWLIQNNKSKHVFSIEKVGDEINAGADELASWAKDRGATFFQKPDTAVTNAFGPVSTWVNNQTFDAAAINTFLQVADFYLIAHALAHKCTVVTHERPAASNRKIKIPNVCIGLGVKCITPYAMLRQERARFVLGG